MDVPTLDRLPFYDDRSRAFPAATGLRLRSYTWAMPGDVLDQGREGACVGFASAHERAARPAVHEVTEADAQSIYRRARWIDANRHGLDCPEGATVLAGMKAGVEAGWWQAYRWAFSTRDLIETVGHRGPVVMGAWWREGMVEPDADGRVRADGDRVGGHAFVVTAVDVAAQVALLVNSWGPRWSTARWRGRTVPGAALVAFDDLDRLLHDEGEAAVPLGRR